MMPLRHRALTAVTTLVLAGGVASAEVPVAGSLAKPPATPAAENPCLKYLPDDAYLAGGLDLKAVIEWLDNSPDTPPFAAEIAVQYLAAAKVISGINPTTEVDGITFFAAGDPQKESTFLVLVSGTYTTAVAEAHMADQFPGAKIDHVGNKNVYTVGKSFAFTFPEAGTLAMGNPALVKAAVEKAKAKVETPKLFTATLQQTDAASFVWLAAKPKAILGVAALADFRKNNDKLSAELEGLDFVSAAFSKAKDGYHLSLTAALADKEKAKALADFLATAKTAAMEKDGVNPLYMPVLIASDLETDDVHVRASVKLTWSALKQIWDTKVVLKK